MSAQTEVTVMNMISQGQIAASQRKLFEGFVAGVAVAALAIALAWGAFAVVNSSKSVAPRATIEYLQEPGLLEQRAGERGGGVAIPSTTKTVSGDSLLEQGRRERAVPPQQHGNGLQHGPLR